MAIDRSGKWWTGTEGGRLREYLDVYTADGYPASHHRPAACACGSAVFHVDADDTEGVARRTRAACGATHLICDSGEFRDEAELVAVECPCGGTTFNVGVGFSLRQDDEDVQWLYVGARCVLCGVLGCYANWKIDYSPSLQLLDGA